MPSTTFMQRHIDKNNPRELFGWKMYDWANSAFYTTVVGTLFGPYITRLAQSYVGENGVVLDLGPLGAVTAKSLPTLCVSISVGAQVFLLPVLGALGDYSDLKKRLMAFFCYIGVIANCLMFFVKGGLYLLGGLLFIVANVAFGAALVFYNAFLPDIATEDQAEIGKGPIQAGALSPPPAVHSSTPHRHRLAARGSATAER